jgi:GNAT acetyltransferase-like protein
MVNDLDLMNIHVRALFIHDAESRLLVVNEPDSEVTVAPRLFLGRTRAGNVWRFRAGLPENLVRELDSLCADEPPITTDFSLRPRHREEYVRLLESNAPVEIVSAGPAYHFPAANFIASRYVVALTEHDAEKLRGGFEKLIEELPAWQPFVALILGDRAVSVCRSVRITSEAHEAGVETLPDFRGNGYALNVTAVWAQRVRSTGALPLYSTSWANTASQSVTRKLGLACYGADFEIV